MKKPAMALTAIFILLAFLTSCITAPVFVAPAPVNEPEGTVTARMFPEVTLTTKDGRSFVGKVACLKGDTVEFRPSPYWNAEAMAIPLDDIDLIRVFKKGGGGAAIGRGFLNGFGFFYTTVGVVGAASSKYNSDYSSALQISALVGLAGGALGAIIGAISSATSGQTVEMHTLARNQKVGELCRIMGR